MKTKKTQIIDGKLVSRKRSPIPFLLAGLVFLVYGLLFPISGFFHYVIAVVLAVVAYAVFRGIWRDELIEQELPPDTGDAQCDQLIAEAREHLEAIREANDRIADPTVSGNIDAIENTARTLLSRMQEQPALQGQLRTFLRYYLPTTHKLLDARASLEGQTAENAALICERTDRVLPEIRTAFEKQMEAIDKHRYLDLQVEMDVLEGMLKSDGYTATK